MHRLYRLVYDLYGGRKQLIRIILSECEELYITFPTDRLGEGQRQSPSDGELPVKEDGTFDTARDTLRGLCRDAKQMQIAVHTPILLGESHRFQNEQLRFVERWMPSLVQRRCPLPCQARPFGKGVAAGAAGACQPILTRRCAMLRHRLYIWCGGASCGIGRLQ